MQFTEQNCHLYLHKDQSGLQYNLLSKLKSTGHSQVVSQCFHLNK